MAVVGQKSRILGAESCTCISYSCYFLSCYYFSCDEYDSIAVLLDTVVYVN
jgi:hypothetical protein